MASRTKSSHGPHGLSAADSARLDTWMAEIADEEIGNAHPVGNNFRAGRSDALIIYPTGVFHDFRDSRHCRGGLSLLRHLRQLDLAKAIEEAREWLANHAGLGKFSPASDSADTQTDNDTERQPISMNCGMAPCHWQQIKQPGPI